MAVRQSGGGGIPSGPAGGVLGGSYPNPSFSSNGTTAILGTVRSILAASVNLASANTWINVNSINITAGTWLILCTGVMAFSGATAYWIDNRLYDGTNPLAEGMANPFGSPGQLTVSMFALYTAAGPVTIYHQAQSNGTVNQVYSGPVTAGGGADATQLIALRIA